jgi:short-subunit dehydrogenase
VFVSSFGGRAGIPAETAYCASKFALCGWAEAMQIDLWDSPLEVRLVIPGPVDTDIWERPGSDQAHYDGPLTPPAEVAEGIVTLMEGDTFEAYLPDLKAVAEFKTTDPDAYLAGAADMARQAEANPG